MPAQPASHQAIIDSLFVEDIRRGHAHWFRVSSGSMSPLLKVGASVCVEPAAAQKIHIGDIAAFETDEGLIIHRILRTQESGDTIRLLQMSDVVASPTWVDEQAVVGRVVAIHDGTRRINLKHPIARWWGRVTAHIRYQLYLSKNAKWPRRVLRVCSRLIVRVGCWCTRQCAVSSTAQDTLVPVDEA